MLNILYGISSLLIGFYILYSTIKKTTSTKSYYSSTKFKMYAGSIIFIMVGITLIIKTIYKIIFS